jgi:hypothetical protein
MVELPQPRNLDYIAIVPTLCLYDTRALELILKGTTIRSRFLPIYQSTSLGLMLLCIIIDNQLIEKMN